MIDTLNPFIEQVTTLKGPMLLVVFLIMLGYALKLTKSFPNRGIPVVNFIIGAALAPIVVAWPSPGSMDPALRFPDIAAWFTSTITGFLLSCVAWLMHDKFLRKFIDNKSPALSPSRTTDKRVETETHIEDGKSQKQERTTTEVTELNPSEKEVLPEPGVETKRAT